MPGRICTICEEREVSPRSRFTTCPVCRGNMGGWKRKGVGAILDYRRKLHVRDSRMESLVDDEEAFTAKQRQKFVLQEKKNFPPKL
jgi:hypothetical protein